MVPPTVNDRQVGAWVLRLKRRRDGKKYYYRHDCCTTARKESSLRMDEKTAKQLAFAISSQHPDFYAWAVEYDARHAGKKAAAAKAAKLSESLTVEDDAVDYSLVEQPKPNVQTPKEEPPCAKSS